jgi:hypothetical protein
MTLRDLLEKGEGTLYVVNKTNPSTVTEIDCVMRSYNAFKEEFTYYAFSLSWYNNNREYVIARKSKAKNNVFRNGQPRFVNISGYNMCLYPTQRDLDKTRYEAYGSIFFLSKEDACDYTINKVKERKQALNAIIVKVNKYKFNVTD